MAAHQVAWAEAAVGRAGRSEAAKGMVWRAGLLAAPLAVADVDAARAVTRAAERVVAREAARAAARAAMARVVARAAVVAMRRTGRVA